MLEKIYFYLPHKDEFLSEELYSEYNYNYHYDTYIY